MTADVDFGDRVTYVDSDGEAHRALVVEPLAGQEYVTVVRGGSSELGKGYNGPDVEVETSVYPHADAVDDSPGGTRHVYRLGWPDGGE